MNLFLKRIQSRRNMLNVYYNIRGKMSDFFYVQLKKILRKNPLAFVYLLLLKYY